MPEPYRVLRDDQVLTENDMAKRKFDPVHPGVVLAEDFLKGLEISQYRLAKGIGVSPRRINEIVQGKLDREVEVLKAA